GICTEIVTPVAATFPAYGVDFSVAVAVNGTTFDVLYEGQTVISNVTDSDLTAGAYGVYSWSQGSNWGTDIKSVSFTSSSVNKSHAFTSDGPVDWKVYTMANSTGGTFTDPTTCNYRLDFTNGVIIQDSDDYVAPTTGFGHIDFLGPAVIVDDEDCVNWDDYKMQVRMANQDDDGIGLLVRVQDDNTFYRVHFTSQGLGASTTRAYQGMSIQKCDNGVWSDLYHEDQEDVQFIYTPELRDGDAITQEAIPFDVAVTVVDNAITVQVIDDPNSATPTVYNYPTVYDNDATYIENGSVGFTAWASGGGINGHLAQSIYSGYGGDMNAPLVVAVPEPSTIILLLMGIGMLVLRKVKQR
ncbi:MAG: PEP-CTERM sorting domain-containing protein, partial [Planctomycetia bacterium]